VTDKIGKQFSDQIAQNRWYQLEEWDRYMRGDFGSASLPSTNHSAVAREYNDLLNRADLPICSLVVNAVTERLQVTGFRDPESDAADEMLWEWFQSSKMDGRQQLLYNDALTFGESYMSVTPGGDMPVFRAESPLNMVVQLDPVDPMRVMTAAKQVKDYGWLYDDVFIYSLFYDRTQPTGWKVIDRIEHNAGQCPIVRFANRVDSRGRTMSEISLVASIQRRIQQTVFDRLMVQRSAAWRQRWVSGISVDVDENGNAVPPFNIGVDQLVISEDPDTKFGDWAASSFGDHMNAVDMDIRQAAAVTQTPPHLLAPHTISNISAEALVALEAGLSAKVADRQLTFGETWEEALQMGGRIVGVDVRDEIETVWADLERRSDAQKVDSALKLRSMGLPMPFLLERIGLTPQATARVMDALESEQAQQAAVSAASFGLASGQSPLDEDDA
jgi:hypothetical protein